LLAIQEDEDDERPPTSLANVSVSSLLREDRGIRGNSASFIRRVLSGRRRGEKGKEGEGWFPLAQTKKSSEVGSGKLEAGIVLRT